MLNIMDAKYKGFTVIVCCLTTLKRVAFYIYMMVCTLYVYTVCSN